MMNLIITSFGAYLHREGERFVVKVTHPEPQEVKYSVRKVRSILITTGSSLSTDALQLALENNIDVVFLDKYGDPFGRVWHGKLGSTSAIRREQLRIADSVAGVELALSWTVRKVNNQLTFLTTAAKKRPQSAKALCEKIGKLQEIRDKLARIKGHTVDAVRQEILTTEANAGNRYWEAINLLLPERYRFQHRSRNPAQDEFNCLLNYAYGVLYGVVERACVLSGLDPYVGFIHTDHYNKKSLVFDLIECYRIWADETVVGLFAARQVNSELFYQLHNGLTLDKPGKAVLIERFEALLATQHPYKNRKIQCRDQVQLECQALASTLLKDKGDEADGAFSVDYL